MSQLTWLGKVESTDTACGIDQPNSSFQIDITGTTRSSPDEPCLEATAADARQG